MLRLFVFVLLFSLSVGVQSYDIDAPLIEIDISNFDTVATSNELCIVLYVINTQLCTDCPVVLRAFQAAVKELQLRLQPPLPFMGVVDVDKSNELAFRHGATQFPIFKVFRKGYDWWRPFQGQHTKSGIIDYISMLYTLPSLPVMSVLEAETLVKESQKDKIIIFSFLTNLEELHQLQLAEDLFRELEDYKFLHTTSDAVMEHYQLKDTFAILHPQRGEEPIVWARSSLSQQKLLTAEDVLDFVSKEGMKKISVYNDASACLHDRIDKPKVKMFVETRKGMQPKQLQYYQSRLSPIIDTFPNLHFIFVGSVVQAKLEPIFALGYDEAQFRHGAAIGIFYDSLKWVPQPLMSTFDTSEIQRFLLAFNKSELKPLVKSEQEPINQGIGKGKVIVVVGTTFQQIVMNESYRVFLVMYAPWCGHCTKVLEQLEILANQVSNQKDLIIAKIDGGQNEIPERFRPSSYPIILYFEKWNKFAAEEYSRARNWMEMKNFIEDRL